MPLNDIVKANSYPILFIGSGISKRYLKDFPNWTELLVSYWGKLNETSDFYAKMIELKKEIEDDEFPEHEIDFETNIRMASYIEERFNAAFINGKISIDGLTTEDVYKNQISAFKFHIANYFDTYELNENVDAEEISSFKTLLSKARIIVTTNYDTFIEDMLDELQIKPKKYVGKEGFFDKTIDWSELYKLHGDVKNPKSIVISKEDYELFDKNSLLVSAKILTQMIESPIIFLGYSLTDRNVQTLLKDFSEQLPDEDLRTSADRIFIAQYRISENEIKEEVVRSNDLNFQYTTLKTDNFKQLYDVISKINQGLTPYEVMKYEKLIKNIVVNSKGNKDLDTVLVSSTELDTLEEDIKNGKNIVVALGDKRFMFVLPDLVSYMKDYILDEKSIMPSVALDFIAKENLTTRTPFSKYVNQSDFSFIDISDETRRIINSKINKLGSLDKTIDSVPRDCAINYQTIEEITATTYSVPKKQNLITHNIKNIDFDSIDQYIKTTALDLFEQATLKKQAALKSALRKLIFAYDLLKYGDTKK